MVLSSGDERKDGGSRISGAQGQAILKFLLSSGGIQPPWTS